jgi:hypothetical protein
MSETPSILADTVHSVSVHNGVARVLFTRLDADNKGQPVVELLIPVNQITQVMKALSTIRRE